MGSGFLKTAIKSLALMLKAPVKVIKANKTVTAGARCATRFPSNNPIITPVGVSKGIPFSRVLLNLIKKFSIIIIIYISCNILRVKLK